MESSASAVQPTRRHPEFFPPSCPPGEAELADQSVFRWTQADPPCADDFKSYHQLGKPGKPTACNRFSLSVFDSKQAAVRRLQELRSKFRDRVEYKTFNVSQIQATSSHGVILRTGQNAGHHDLWLFDGVDLSTVAQTVWRSDEE